MYDELIMTILVKYNICHCGCEDDWVKLARKKICGLQWLENNNKSGGVCGAEKCGAAAAAIH